MTRIKLANLILLGLYSLILFLLALVWIQPFVSPDVLLRDIFVVAAIPRYYGLISNFGIFLWGATAIVTLFSANILAAAKQTNLSKFFFYFSLISFWLGLDDFLMLHEHVFIPENIIFLIYVLVVVGSLIRFRNIIIKSDFRILLVGFLFLLISILLDKILIFTESKKVYILEDGSKLLRIISWCFYFTQTSINQIKCLIEQSQQLK